MDSTALFENALLTATYGVQTATIENTTTPTVRIEPAQPSETPSPIPPTPDLNRTPPALPPVFQSDIIHPNDFPTTYIEDTCEYLLNKWDPNNSAPGTVVMPIMFHSISGGEATKQFQISHAQLEEIFYNLNEQNFKPISIHQLVDFLYNNASIPQRSFILIVDDRHYSLYFEDHFKATLQEYGWQVPVTNGWISHPETLQEVWDGNIRLNNEGWVSHQGHGVVHNIPLEEWPANTYLNIDLYGQVSAEEYATREIAGSYQSIIEKFGEAPIAYIWPGGGFSTQAVEIARETGYQVAFTINPRGPLMFNWIPLSNEEDPSRPSFKSEGYIDDPLMVLPRYWDVDSVLHIDEVRQISKASANYENQNMKIELEYYDIVCRPITGDLPSLENE
ncbi:MAG: polysaccharide deacetylase family protein [Anaerolineaceae bacterium]|nr:polysaccharide deacetylase family protein [Anaerolineaceae bacterium]